MEPLYSIKNFVHLRFESMIYFQHCPFQWESQIHRQFYLFLITFKIQSSLASQII